MSCPFPGPAPVVKILCGFSTATLMMLSFIGALFAAIPDTAGDQNRKAEQACSCHDETSRQGFHATVKNVPCGQCHPGVHARGAPALTPAEVPAPAPPVFADCTFCHSAPRHTERFRSTSHGALGCAACHRGIGDLDRHRSGREKPAPVSCAACHQEIGRAFARSAHSARARLTCLRCHDDIHPRKTGADTRDKASILLACTKCHEHDEYAARGHGARILAGNHDSASCGDCHGVHDTPVFPATDEGIAARREHYSDRCISCHRRGGVAGHYGAFPLAVEAYGETYHGKARRLGNGAKVAGCQDCHAGHNLLPADDPDSALHPRTLVRTCAKCHSGFHPRFVSYVPHPDPDRPGRFATLYLTKKFMLVLLTTVFLFFWAHSLLWWRKVYAHRSRLVQNGWTLAPLLPGKQGRQYVRRFSPRDRLMHVILILSFFGVVISGIPLKYPDSPWARTLVSLLGGADGAGSLHRLSAVVMWLLFLFACGISIGFLFPGFRFKGFAGRLFGPDSLFPRAKDLRDCRDMIRWFLNRGEKPRLDRWTYWEKFDFLAVFWGMFLIGFSGIVMWQPELCSHLMPGWMINIVSTAHSEEAFLAAVFIFTIHFFNNHLVPDKFPLEKNIFTGCYTLEALRRERPAEFDRLAGENRLEGLFCKGPQTAMQLFAEVFGIAAVLFGLALTVLIFWAVLG